MVSVDQAYMVGHMKNADGSINNKNVVLSAACEAAELFQCMMSVNQKLEDWQRFNHTLEMHLRSVECRKLDKYEEKKCRIAFDGTSWNREKFLCRLYCKCTFGTGRTCYDDEFFQDLKRNY